MNAHRYGTLAIALALSGCVTTQQKKLTEAEAIEIQIKQIRAIAETSLETSRSAEKISKDAFEKAQQANDTSAKAMETANKAVEAVNETRTFATREADRAIAASNQASENAIAAANKSSKMAIEYAERAAEQAVAKANEAVRAANESADRAVRAANDARDKAIAVANQAIAEVNRMRATVRMAPPVEPIVQEEPDLKKSVYVVQKGDTLASIARKVYGNSSRWNVIYERNREVIKNPKVLVPGCRLVIP